MNTFSKGAVIAGLMGGLLSGTLALNAAGTRDYPCYRLPFAPVMDGRLDGKAWAALPEATGFTILPFNEYHLEKQTLFRMGWTDDSLYLAVQCVEPVMSAVKGDATDGDNVLKDDSVELFLAPNSDGRYHQLMSNSAGARWNATGTKTGTGSETRAAKPWNWEARSGKWDKGWQLEIRIPFSVLGQTPSPDSQWQMNIARDITTGSVRERNTTWASPKSYRDFGQLVFKDTTPSAELAASESRRLNAPFAAYLRMLCLKRSELTDDPELRDALKDHRWAKNAASLKSLSAELAQVGKNTDADPLEVMALLTRRRELKAALLTSTLPLTLDLSTRDAGDVRVTVNGKTVERQKGDWPIELQEGLNIIGLTATADGKAPGLRVRIPGRPELAKRWRAGVAADGSWLVDSFDDRAWQVAESDKNGYLCWPDDVAGSAHFRQIVLWGKHHYSGMPCIQPKVREWGFPEKGMENLFHTLYSPPPLGFPLENYEFVLDVPEGFRLLEEEYDAGLNDGDRYFQMYNRRPHAVLTEHVQHGGQTYTRYRFMFRPEYVRPCATAFTPKGTTHQVSLIPLLLDEFKGADRACRFYYRRLASGNVTELEQQLPVRVLPPVNGRMPRKVGIQQYGSVPYRGSRLSPEHFDAHMRQSFDAGFNRWVVGASYGEPGRKVYDHVLERGGTVVIWGCWNYPLQGAHVPWVALGKWIRATPDARVRYFNGGFEWDTEWEYCRSFATGKGVSQFSDAVKKDIALQLHGGAKLFVGFPKAAVYWNDFELTAWRFRQEDKGRHHCFCDRCKEAFRHYTKLPDTADLSDDSIKNNYKTEWTSFRAELDGRVNGIVRDVCRELGLQYQYYDMFKLRENWEHLKGRMDIAFPGLPGSNQVTGQGPADGVFGGAYSQANTDRGFGFIHESTGLPRSIGQLFASNYPLANKPWEKGWSQSAIAAADGFNHVKRVKSQILRVVAASHGGVDLCTSMERCAGQRYYIGETTRLISEYEDLFWDGDRADGLAESAQIKYPNLLVLRNDDERLVLLFNEGAQPLTVQLRNKDVKPGHKATIYYAAASTDTPEKIRVTIPPEDVEAVHIR